MQVLEHEHRRPLGGEPFEEPPPAGECLAAAVGTAALLGYADQRAQHRTDPVDVLSDARARDELVQLRLGDVCRIALEDPGLGLDHLPERPIADALAIGQRAPLPPANQLRLALDRGRELLHEAALAHPRDADDRDQLRLALSSSTRKRAEQLVQLAHPPDQLRPRPQLDVDAEKGACGYHLPDDDRCLLALRLHRRVRPVLDSALSRVVRRLSHEDPVYRSRALEARGRIDDVTGDLPLTRLRPGADGHERLARVHGQPHLEATLLDRPVTNRERRAHCAFRVVFVYGRRSENGDDSVADELLDRAAAPLELLADSGMERRQLGPHVLRVEPLGACRRSDEVTEDDGDDLPLLDARSLVSKPLSALGAELGGSHVLGPTRRTDLHESPSATASKRMTQATEKCTG